MKVFFKYSRVIFHLEIFGYILVIEILFVTEILPKNKLKIIKIEQFWKTILLFFDLEVLRLFIFNHFFMLLFLTTQIERVPWLILVRIFTNYSIDDYNPLLHVFVRSGWELKKKRSIHLQCHSKQWTYTIFFLLLSYWIDCEGGVQHTVVLGAFQFFYSMIFQF